MRAVLQFTASPDRASTEVTCENRLEFLRPDRGRRTLTLPVAPERFEMAFRSWHRTGGENRLEVLLPMLDAAQIEWLQSGVYHEVADPRRSNNTDDTYGRSRT